MNRKIKKGGRIWDRIYAFEKMKNHWDIRDKHVVVHGGAFAGELLADLLEKDLMDLPVESAENEESPTEIAA